MAPGHGVWRRCPSVAARRVALGVVWTAGALRGLNAIRTYLHSFNPVAARRIAQALLLAGDSLSMFPSRGRIGSELGTRELVAVQPSVLVYEATNIEVTVLAVWRGAQDR